MRILKSRQESQWSTFHWVPAHPEANQPKLHFFYFFLSWCFKKTTTSLSIIQGVNRWSHLTNLLTHIHDTLSAGRFLGGPVPPPLTQIGNMTHLQEKLEQQTRRRPHSRDTSKTNWIWAWTRTWWTLHPLPGTASQAQDKMNENAEITRKHRRCCCSQHCLSIKGDPFIQSEWSLLPAV